MGAESRTSSPLSHRQIVRAASILETLQSEEIPTAAFHGNCIFILTPRGFRKLGLLYHANGFAAGDMMTLQGIYDWVFETYLSLATYSHNWEEKDPGVACVVRSSVTYYCDVKLLISVHLDARR